MMYVLWVLTNLTILVLTYYSIHEIINIFGFGIEGLLSSAKIVLYFIFICAQIFVNHVFFQIMNLDKIPSVKEYERKTKTIGINLYKITLVQIFI